jgi:hypothetical protein
MKLFNTIHTPTDRVRNLLFVVVLASIAPGVHGAELFTDGAKDSGLDFVHFNGMSGEFYLVENLGGGGALFDFDNDGDLDVYLVQGRMLGKGKTLSDALVPPPPDQSLSDRLYRNDLVNTRGNRQLGFSDVTQASDIRATEYGMGVAAGDYNNDGWTDLYLTNFGNNQLWRNDGDGSFSEVSEKAGVREPRLSVSAAFLDFDRDGWLDLYVGNYVDFTTAGNKRCEAPSSAHDYCSPQIYPALPDRLFRNRGDGSFKDVTAAAGIDRAFGPALGVVAADFNGDGWVDVYVANDGAANQMWINQKNGTFRDEGLMSGTAVNMEGAAEASMGVDAADFDGDGDEDLFMTHLIRETNTIYVNDGQGWFEDRTVATGLAAPSKAFTAFGTAWFDYDRDGWLDLFVANGAVNIILSLVRASDPYPLHQTNQLFANLGPSKSNEGKSKGGKFKEGKFQESKFEEITERAGEVFALSEVSRGAAFGDIDNDGDADVLVVNNNGPARLLMNNVDNPNHWLGLTLLDSANRHALGARVAVTRADDAVLWRRVRADGSYASANDPRVLVGLGPNTRVPKVRVYWPSGRVEAWTNPPIDRYTTLHEGQGEEILNP